MNFQAETQSRPGGMAGEPASRTLFALMLVIAGIGAAVAPFVADVVTAGVGVMLAFAVWTTLRQGPRPGATTNLLGAV
jgi:hypothetical protein